MKFKQKKPSKRSVRAFYNRHNPHAEHHWTETKNKKFESMIDWLKKKYQQKENENAINFEKQVQQKITKKRDKMELDENESEEQDANDASSTENVECIFANDSNAIIENNMNQTGLNLNFEINDNAFNNFNSLNEQEMKIDLEASRTNPTQAILDAQLQTRQNEEGEINASSAYNKLQQTRIHTKIVVSDIVDSALPRIVNNQMVQKLVREEKANKTQLIRGLSQLKGAIQQLQTTMVRNFAVMNSQINKLSNQSVQHQQKRRRYNNNSQNLQNYEPNDFDF